MNNLPISFQYREFDKVRLTFTTDEIRVKTSEATLNMYKPI